MAKKTSKNVSIVEDIEKVSIADFSRRAYLDYSMYVILDRALPHIGDGLKPVQRRIVFAMSELGLKQSAKYKKSARTIGDVIGKFHPHGDSAVYEAMVLMAQPFSYRYPLVDGQGNFGSQDDPKSFAAMRYTESKLTNYSQVLLSEISDGTIEKVPNFDATLFEPKIMPSQLPNILLNGTTGIAVGMTSDVPPHNLSEVVDGCLFLLDNPKATIKDLTKIIKGPDYPTGAEIITQKSDIAKIYETGNGMIKMRAQYSTEKNDIIITALPYQVSGAKILEQIANQIRAKKLMQVSDLRDESDHENPTRLVITPRSKTESVDAIMAHLFATTDLERNYKVNLNVIGLNGKPRVFSLLELLNEWLVFREDIVTKRLEYRLEKVLARLHILDGLFIAFLNIDEVIHIIRNNDNPKPKLIAKFKLSDIQAEAILELKLRHLAKLEENKIKTEQNDLSKERDSLQATLKSKTKLKNLIKKELTVLKDKFGDKRLCKIVARDEAKAFSESETLASYPITVVLSNKGWVRQAKGHEVELDKLSYKSGDNLLDCALGNSNEQVVFFDSSGRSYAVMAYNFPSVRSHGEPLTAKLKPPAKTNFIAVSFADKDSHYLVAGNSGYGLIVPKDELYTKNKAGKAILKLKDNEKALAFIKLDDINKQKVAVLNSEGRLLLFPLKDMPVMAKGRGVKMFSLSQALFDKGDESIKDIQVVPAGASIILTSGKRSLTLKSKDLNYYAGARATRGRKLPKGYQTADKIVVI